MHFELVIWGRASEVGCCSYATCHLVDAGSGDIDVTGLELGEIESSTTFPVIEPWADYCIPLGGDMGCERQIVTGTLTLTEFSPATGVVSGSYSLVIYGTEVTLSDVFSGTICRPIADMCGGW